MERIFMAFDSDKASELASDVAGKHEPSNWLLAAVPGEQLSSFQPHLEAVSLVGGSVLLELDEPLTRVYFVETGVVALLTAFENRVIVGAATVGREGAVGVASLLLGGETAPGRFKVLVPGSALAVEVSAFQSALRRSPNLRMGCETHARALLVQLLQTVPCNKLHTVEQRCARWLLMCADRTEDDTFEVTQGSLAEMLGVSPTMVSVMVRALQRTKPIRYERDMVMVLDRVGLEATGCECYRIVRERCHRQRACAFE